MADHTNRHHPAGAAFRRSRLTMLVATWLAYGTYTMARRPFTVGRAAIMADTQLSQYGSGMVDTSFLIFYTIGQLVYGSHIKPLGYSSKTILLVGLCGAAFSCFIVSLSSSAWLFSLAWGLNGAFQAAGWASCITIITPWLGAAERGVIMGIWGSNMAVGGVVGNALTASLIDAWGSWRSAVIANVVVIGAVVVFVFLFLRRHPNNEGFLSPSQADQGVAWEQLGRAMSVDGEMAIATPHPEAGGGGDITTTTDDDDSRFKSGKSTPRLHPQQALSTMEVLRLPGVFGLSASYFFHKLVRYSLLFWLPYLFAKELGYTNAKAGYVASMVDLGGVIGSVAGGYFTDWYMGGRRRAFCVILFSFVMAGLVVALSMIKALLAVNVGVAAAISGAIGFFAFAIDSVMTSSLQQDIAERAHQTHNIGAISGIVGGIGTLGSVFQGFITAYLSGQSWEVLFMMMAALTVVAGFLLASPAKLERSHLIGVSGSSLLPK